MLGVFVLGLFFSFFPFLDDPTLTSPTSSLCNYCPPPSLPWPFQVFLEGSYLCPTISYIFAPPALPAVFFAPTSCILHQHALLLFPPPPHLMMVQVFLLLQLLCKIHEFCFLNFSISPQKHDKVQVDKFGYIFSDLENHLHTLRLLPLPSSSLPRLLPSLPVSPIPDSSLSHSSDSLSFDPPRPPLLLHLLTSSSSSSPFSSFSSPGVGNSSSAIPSSFSL